VVLKMTGPDRAALYRVAAGTGFRANELRSLTPESFDLAADPPTVTVKAAYSKRRRDDSQPIRPDLAAALRPWIAGKAPGRHVFGDLTKHTAKLMRHDLEAAGLPYRDASGRVADFHALRHSYITALAMSKAPVKVIQSLARHSTPSLTFGVYAHVGLYDQTAALDALPGPIIPCSEATAPASSGGDGGRINDLVAHYLPTAGDGSCQNLTHAGGDAESPAHTEALDGRDRKPLESLDSDVASRVLKL
jgi:Phage integrase family